MYSQNNEELYILNYFGDVKGRFLDIGAADGFTLSNTFALLEKGWTGVEVEPSPEMFVGLMNNIHSKGYADKVELVNAAITDQGGFLEFQASADFVSTFSDDHKKLWESAVKFKKIHVATITMFQLLNKFKGNFEFINLDVEGINWELLRKIPLKEVGCRCICVEYENNLNAISNYLTDMGYNLLYQSPENLVMGL